jgi:signal transduction histidine kinase
MSIRLKLLLSYAAMLIIPLVLMIITAMLLVFVFRGDLKNLHDTYGQDHGPFENRSVERLLKEIKRTAEQTPSGLNDLTYLNDIDQELQTSKSYLIIRKDNQNVFISPTLQQPELVEQLPTTARAGHSVKEEMIQNGKELYHINYFDFVYSDQRHGSVFVVTMVSPIVNFAQKFFPILFISLLVILILTHTLLTFFVSRSIIRPLQTLKHAMKKLKEGDLDFQVQITNKDEIGQLSLTFEQMRKQLQQSIQTQLQYEENRKELISNISHDLRTPLTAIRGYIDGLEDGIADTPDKRQRYIEIISSKAEEMDQLIDELFLYSKLDLKQLPFNFEIIDMSAFLLDWSDELEFELGKKGVCFDSDIKLSPETKVSIDRDKLRRVFSNVIQNGLKYMDKEERHIHLQSYASTGQVIIKITDNGQGIDEDALPYIFERFYRADQSRNSHSGGSGLGLAISKQIIDGHGGTIQAHSIKGEQTCVTIALPLRSYEYGDNE